MNDLKNSAPLRLCVKNFLPSTVVVIRRVGTAHRLLGDPCPPVAWWAVPTLHVVLLW